MTVSRRRCFLGGAPLAVSYLPIYGLVHPDCGRVQDAFYERLGLDGVDVVARCEKLFQGPLNVWVTWDGELSVAAVALEGAISQIALGSD